MSKVELFEYDGYLSIEIPPLQAATIARSAQDKGLLGLEIGRGSLVFKYSGRDTNRWVVDFLRQLAAEVGDACGEIVCTLTHDDSDPTFEFYRISGGRLIRQRGSIVRQPSQDVGEG